MSSFDSEFSEIKRSVEATHAGNDVRELSVKPLLYIIEEIFQPATPSVPGFDQGTQIHDDFQFDLNVMLDLLSSTINEISSKMSSGGDEHETTLGILKTLGSYNWDAKVVLALVAFAFNLGDFLVMAQPYSSNPLLESVPLLEELPTIRERFDTFKLKLVELSNLVKDTLNITKCIVEFIEFKSPVPQKDEIPDAVYWTIRCIVFCSTQILGLTGMGRGNISSIAEATFARKVSSMHIDLKNQLHQLKEDKRSTEASQTPEEVHSMMTRVMEVHTDNIQVMRRLIYTEEDDQLPLLKGDTETRASIEVLRSKHVLLLISDMKITDEELFILKKMYGESHNDQTRSQYEVVWIPIGDRSTRWTHAMQDQFENCQLRMPWYSVYHPFMVDSAVITYIEKVWKFKENPILVVIDPKGNVLNENAFHIIWIWGDLAFPFTSSRVAELWASATQDFKFLAGSIAAAIPIWRAEENYICLYGGGNIDWIKKFTAKSQAIAKAAHIKLQILYVGKSNPGEHIRENISTITVEKLSHSLQDLPLVKFFWERLKIICHSRMKLGLTLENDPLMQDINAILSLDNSDEGWAVFCRGSDMAIAKSENILQCLSDFDLWRTYMKEKDFVTTLKHYHRKLLLVQLMESPHKDNMEVLRALIHAEEDQPALLKADAGELASIKVLKNKTVLFVISDLEFDDEELLFMLDKIYAAESHQFEMVCIPIVDRSTPWTESQEFGFHCYQWIMPGYSPYELSQIDLVVIMYIEQVWNFKEEPILVVLDPQGKLVNNNALDMLWIWGSLAFPFTSAREAELWKRQTWGIKLLAESIKEAIPNWVAEENYICLYGGGNIDWIKKFTAKAQTVADDAHIKLQILYVGKRNPGEQIQINISTITEEKLSNSLKDLSLVRFFWERLKIICHSRMKLGFTLENDPIMQEINNILSFRNSDEGWTVFCWGSAMAMANGEIILQCLSDFDLWRKYMNDKDFVTALNHYRRLQLMESPRKDNLEILRALICAKEDQLPLLKVKGDTKERASIEVLKNKTLLLLITDLEFANEELFMLEQSYKSSRQDPSKQYEIVWIPVVDWLTQWKQGPFENLQSRMPWYSVYHPLMIKPGVLMCTEQVWKLKKKPIVVVLEPEGKVVNNNALHMLRIWGSLAFPFTSTREAELWTQEISRIELLADSIDATIPIWIQEENYICLYGGENVDWIKEFTATASKVAEASCITLQILYVGKSNSNEKQVRKIIDTITVEKLSHSLQEYHQVWFFWQRLESMWHSKTQPGCTVENDPILQEINTLLSFDKNHEEWAVFCRGTAMAKAKGETILQCLKDFDSWKTHMKDKDFVTALNHHLNETHTYGRDRT